MQQRSPVRDGVSIRLRIAVLTVTDDDGRKVTLESTRFSYHEGGDGTSTQPCDPT